ncbi:MAG: DNA mismatch repair endonuclease MutL [Cyanobacteria bacterium P01_G01_bin.4]
MSIRPLPQTTVDLMVAGEAIDSLAAAVRELIENSLDAGANRIAVQVWPDRWTVRVTDDGCGMTASELERAALPYCTSKLGRDSLSGVNTLGFRGKALHSLAQVSGLDIRTFAVSEEHAWLATYNRDGIPRSLQPTAAAKGTTVTASDLFANWPARRITLANRKAELRRITEIVQQTALAHPTVTWTLQVNDKLTLDLWPGDTAADILPQLIRRLDRSQLASVESDGVSVILALPDRYHRPRPDWIRVAVNGRCVRLPQVVQTIQSAFHRTLPRDRHPLCIAHLHLPPERVDWNRHPAKAELYVQDLDGVCDCLRETIQTALADCAPSSYQRSRQFLFDRQTTSRQTAARGLKESSTRYGQGLEPVRVLGQLQNTYVLVETVQGLWLVEQHVAHERVQYEQLQQEWGLEELGEPLLLSGLTDDSIDRLQELGIEPEEFGEDLWAVRQIPKLLRAEPDPAAALRDLATCSNVDLATATLACRTAIQNGTPLSDSEMSYLIRAWQTTRNPHTCPHGRPIYLALNESDLSRFFRRSWTVCSQQWGNGLGSSKERKLGDRFSADILGSSRVERNRPPHET